MMGEDAIARVYVRERENDRCASSDGAVSAEVRVSEWYKEGDDWYKMFQLDEGLMKWLHTHGRSCV